MLRIHREGRAGCPRASSWSRSLGPPAAVTRTLAGLALLPEVEPVVVLGNDSDRPAYGDYRSVPGLRQPLLVGLERSGRLSRGLRLSWRSLGLVRSARRYHRTEITHDVRLTGVFDVLAHSQALIVAGTDWPDDAAPGREWWRLMTTMLVARTMNVPVFVSDGTAPDGTGARDALVRWLVARLSSPIEDGPFPSQSPDPSRARRWSAPKQQAKTSPTRVVIRLPRSGSLDSRLLAEGAVPRLPRDIGGTSWVHHSTKSTFRAGSVGRESRRPSWFRT